MRKEELEYNIKKYVYQLIDEVFPETNLISKIENRTAKYWVEQNQWRLDDILSAFTDRNENIDVNQLANMYDDILFDNGDFRLSFRDIVPSTCRSIIPDKIFIFHKEDLHKLIGID